ncbi:AGE family epimerase/isomerase [Flavobacterium bomense]|nr:AGE family epimerase/isomerase [Flavobacterium bomense]
MSTQTIHLKTELTTELDNILEYWSKNTIDQKNGGFIGQIDCNEYKNFEAEKGSVLNARILWSFSAAYSITKNEAHKKIAKDAFEFILTYFYDIEFGGIFWSINPDKTPKDTKNQIYALAFVIY